MTSSLLKNCLWPRLLGGTPRAFALLNTTPDVEMLEKVRTLADGGVVKCVVESVWPMEEAVTVSHPVLISHGTSFHCVLTFA